MTDEKVTSHTDFIQSHTLLPGYQLPTMVLSNLEQERISLLPSTLHQHLVLIFLALPLTNKTAKTLHQECNHYRHTLQALDTQLLICLSQLPAITLTSHLPEQVLIDNSKQLTYALQQSTLSSSQPNSAIIVIKKSSLVHGVLPFQFKQLHSQLREVVDIVRLFN